MIGWLLRALGSNAAETHPDHPDRGLRGRSYAIPFERVWSAALVVAEDEVTGWAVQRWDDRAGIVYVESTSRFPRRVDDVRIHVSLDPNAQTRLDVNTRPRSGRFDLGLNARRVASFLELLDRALAPQEHEVLPTEYARTVVSHRAPAA